jgi:hypothetical protein
MALNLPEGAAHGKGIPGLYAGAHKKGPPEGGPDPLMPSLAGKALLMLRFLPFPYHH